MNSSHVNGIKISGVGRAESSRTVGEILCSILNVSQKAKAIDVQKSQEDSIIRPKKLGKKNKQKINVAVIPAQT